MRQRPYISTCAIVSASVLVTLSTATLAAPHLTDLIVPTIEYPPLDVEWLLEDDIRRAADGQPLRFAVPQEALVTPGNNGLWDRNAEGRLRWRMRFTSPGAPHINIGFEQWNMPIGGEMMVESIDGTHGFGPFTSLDNEYHGELWLPVVIGDDIMVSITCDDDERETIEQNIAATKVNIGYRGFGAEKFSDNERSGSCNVDVVCPEGDPWQSEIACAALYSLSGWFTCSGGMLNNTAQDLRPFFLTADHCGCTSGNDQTMVVYWNYQNSYCRIPGSGDSGGNGNGSLNQQTTGGAILRADNSNSDFTLVELNNDPNSSYNVGFCGWDRRTVTPQQGICIHHPNLDEKRISFEYDTLSSSGYMWRVNDWDLGTTEPGSSGSILFSQDHRVVGQLYGGLAACNNDEYDVFGKLSSSWNLGLGDWLDYAGTGEQYVETYGGSGGNGGVCCLNGSCYNVPEANCNSAGGTWYPDVYCGDVNCADPDPTGGCCTGTTCSVTTEAGCVSGGGSYLGDGTDCSGDPCAPDPTGACCIGTSCSVTTEANCGGTYQGDNTDCNGNPCGTGGDNLSIRWKVIGTDLLSDGSANYTVDVYAETPDQWRIEAIAGNQNQQKTVASTTSFYQDFYGGPTSQGVNPALYPMVPDLEWDSRVTIGCLDSSGDPFSENALNDIGIDWTNFENGGDLSVGNGTWFIVLTDDQGDSQPFTDSGCTQRNGVLIARLTTMEYSSEILFEALFQGRDASNVTWQDIASGTITYEGEQDCNGNGNPDACDIANGDSDDANGNGIPDECESDCSGDADGDGDTDVDDILFIINGFGSIYDVDDLLNAIADFGCTG